MDDTSKIAVEEKYHAFFVYLLKETPNSVTRVIRMTARPKGSVPPRWLLKIRRNNTLNFPSWKIVTVVLLTAATVWWVSPYDLQTARFAEPHMHKCKFHCAKATTVIVF